MGDTSQQQVFESLTALWNNDDIPVLDIKQGKFILFSDIHFGNGSRSDDIRHNTSVLHNVLDHYKKQGFSLILIGDIEELWQFDLEEITAQYGESIYKTMRAFGDDRVYRIYGNHDDDWKIPQDPVKNKPPAFLNATEALKLRYKSKHPQFLLVHGHQGDAHCDKKAWRSRFFVRLYRKIEPFLKIDPHTSATKSQVNTKFEKTKYLWAKDEKVILICGHSHRAIFASKSYTERLKERISEIEQQIVEVKENRDAYLRLRAELKACHIRLKREKKKKRVIETCEPGGEPVPCYFNTGCALFTDGITGLEIEEGNIRLVKWEFDEAKKIKRINYQETELDDVIKKMR